MSVLPRATRTNAYAYMRMRACAACMRVRNSVDVCAEQRVRSVRAAVGSPLPHCPFCREDARNSVNEVIEPRALREIYYPPFEACVRAGVASISAPPPRQNTIARLCEQQKRPIAPPF